VLEALTHGLPVVCLDLGGPAEMVDASCGRVVASAGTSAAACAEAIADALQELARTDGLLPRLSAGARARAESMRWPAVVGGLYADVARRLRHPAAAATDPTLGHIQPRHP
jgi:glycosyltransferase involved in cell wall biosynthesis